MGKRRRRCGICERLMAPNRVEYDHGGWFCRNYGPCFEALWADHPFRIEVELTWENTAAASMMQRGLYFYADEEGARALGARRPITTDPTRSRRYKTAKGCQRAMRKLREEFPMARVARADGQPVGS